VARVGLSITKSTSFRNATQEFSNVYYYECGTLPNASEANTLIDAVTAVEKGFHSTAVTFVRGRVWSETGNQATSNMISQKALSGTGTTTLVTAFDKERAFLFRWRAGTDSRGNAVYLRKWYHSCGNGPGNNPPSTANLENTSTIGSASRSAMESAVGALQSITSAGISYTLRAKSGRQIDAGAVAVAHNYLEHRQLGDQWRAQ
jgi:hypothetical protein